jgi:hypothetical protein
MIPLLNLCVIKKPDARLRHALNFYFCSTSAETAFLIL